MALTGLGCGHTSDGTFGDSRSGPSLHLTATRRAAWRENRPPEPSRGREGSGIKHEMLRCFQPLSFGWFLTQRQATHRWRCTVLSLRVCPQRRGGPAALQTPRRWRSGYWHLSDSHCLMHGFRTLFRKRERRWGLLLLWPFRPESRATVSGCAPATCSADATCGRSVHLQCRCDRRC